MGIETVIRVARFLRVPAFLKFLRLYRPTTSVLRRIEAAAWKRRAKKLYSQFIRRGDIAFDVGAHRGTRTEIFRKLGATVVAIEPQQPCMDVLRTRFKTGVFFEQVALGRVEGYAEMMINDVQDGTSTLSKEFIDTVSRSGRPGDCRENWGRKITVPVKTLDSLISRYGCPSFVKIDVEGFEYEVLMGLSHPINAISIEFVPAYFEPVARAVARLSSLGFTEFNYSIWESMQLSLPEWVTAGQVIAIIRDMPDKFLYGDIYARRAAKNAG